MPLPKNHNSVSSKFAFVEKDFHCWSNIHCALNSHCNAEFHKSAVTLLLESKKSTVLEKLSALKKREMMENRIALRKIFTTVQYLVRQGLALRGHADIESNFNQLLILRCEDVPELKSWMQRKNFKWLHHSIIDEIVKLMTNEIRKQIYQDIQRAEKFAIMADETSDISKTEQVSICIRVVHRFIGRRIFYWFFRNSKHKGRNTIQSNYKLFQKRKFRNK